MADLEQFEVDMIQETAQAWLFDCDDKEVWIPKSQVDDYEFDLVGTEEIVTSIWIPTWLAEDKGLL